MRPGQQGADFVQTATGMLRHAPCADAKDRNLFVAYPALQDRYEPEWRQEGQILSSGRFSEEATARNRDSAAHRVSPRTAA